MIVDQVTETEIEDQDAPEVDSEAEATGQMEQFNQMLMQLMQESNPMQQGIM